MSETKEKKRLQQVNSNSNHSYCITDTTNAPLSKKKGFKKIISFFFIFFIFLLASQISKKK